MDARMLRSEAAMRALAHPLRPRLLSSLRRHGPSTASELAEAFGLTSGDTSYHLRQLAKFGFIEEEPREGDRRQRWWRATTEVTSFDPQVLASSPGRRDALRALQRQRAALHGELLDRYLELLPNEDPRWAAAVATTDAVVDLEPEQFAAMVNDLHSVLARYSAHAGDVKGSRAVHVAFTAFPLVDP